MKNVTTAFTQFVVALAVVLLASNASAAELLHEAFNYPNGNLVGNGGWTAHSAAGLVPIQVTSGAAVVATGSGSREDDNAPFAAQATTAKTYACFLVTVPAGVAPIAAGASDYFAHFRTSTNFNFRSRVYVVGVDATHFKFGIAVTSGPVAQTWPSNQLYGTSYRIVTSYDGTAGTGELWVDPILATDAHLTDTNIAAAGEPVDSYALRQGSAITATQNVDNLVVSTSFDPCDQPTATQSATWGGVKSLYR